MNFSDDMADLDISVGDHLCDDAARQRRGSGPLVPARVMVDRPADAERLQGSSFVRARPVLSVSVDAHQDLMQGDTFILGVWVGDVFTPGHEAWRLAEAPRRPGDGRWWVAEVEPWTP